MSISRETREAGIKRTGELMLSGWKMLATVCPICHSALLSKQGQLQCPMCNMPILTEEEYEDRVATGSGFSASADNSVSVVEEPPSGEHNGNESDDAGPEKNVPEQVETVAVLEPVVVPSSYDEMRREYDLKNKQRDAASARLGEKMLAGWTMLGSVCPSFSCAATPLMRKGSSGAGGPMLCVSCGKEFCFSDYDGSLETVNAQNEREEKQHQQQQQLQQQQQQQQQQQVSNTTDTPTTIVDQLPVLQKQKPQSASTHETVTEEEAQFLSPLIDLSSAPIVKLGRDDDEEEEEDGTGNKSVFDASKKLAEKLMKGWAMLEDVCLNPHCSGNAPLMRDRSGVVQCVCCGHIRGQPLPVPIVPNKPPVKEPVAPTAVSASHSHVQGARASRRSRRGVNQEEDDGDDGQKKDVGDDDQDDDADDLDEEEAYTAYVHTRLQSQLAAAAAAETATATTHTTTGQQQGSSISSNQHSINSRSSRSTAATTTSTTASGGTAATTTQPSLPYSGDGGNRHLQHAESLSGSGNTIIPAAAATAAAAAGSSFSPSIVSSSSELKRSINQTAKRTLAALLQKLDESAEFLESSSLVDGTTTINNIHDVANAIKSLAEATKAVSDIIVA